MSSYTEKDMMTDCLSSEKFLSSVYNTYALECVDPNIKKSFLTMLNDVQQIQSELFTEMLNRQWYQVEQVQPQKVSAVKQKLQSMS